MNQVQEGKLQELNDNYSVDRWEEEGTDLHIYCDDGDEALIDKDGYVTWKSVAP